MMLVLVGHKQFSWLIFEARVFLLRQSIDPKASVFTWVILGRNVIHLRQRNLILVNVFTDAGFDAIRRIVVAKIGNSSKDIMTVQSCECPPFRDAVRFERFFLVICSCGASLAYCSRQSKRFSPLSSWVWLSLRTHVKRVNQRSAESRGFFPGAPVSSHRES